MSLVVEMFASVKNGDGHAELPYVFNDKLVCDDVEGSLEVREHDVNAFDECIFWRPPSS
jgi:hypothetical protein